MLKIENLNFEETIFQAIFTKKLYRTASVHYRTVVER